MRTRIILLVAGFFIAWTGVAQTGKASVGLSFSSYFVTDGTNVYSEDYHHTIGPHLGVSAPVLSTDLVSVWTGLGLTTRGFTYNFTYNLFGEEWEQCGRQSMFYLDVPLLARVDFQIKSLQFYGAAGWYLAYGLYGRQVLKEGPVGDLEVTDRYAVEWGSDGYYRRLDHGANAALGIQFNQFDFELAYLLGLRDLSSSDIGLSRVYNRSFRFTVGYYLGE